MRKVHSNIPAFECNICHKNFKLSIHLDLHEKLCKISEPGISTSSVGTDSEVKSNFSEICSKSEGKTNEEKKKLLLQSPNLKKHQKDKHETEDQTMNNFFKKSNFTRAIKKLKLVASKDEIKYTSEMTDGIVYQRCSICRRLLQNHIVIMEQHTNSHLENRPYKCDYCDKRFLTKPDSNRHMRTHADKRMFPCKYCPQKFLYSPARATHMRLHTGLKIYRCQHCLKKFHDYRDMYHHTIKKHIL